MSKCLFLFDEYGKGMGLPSITEYFEDSPYEGQDKIIEYLKTQGTCGYASGSFPKDFFTGEVICGVEEGLNDGEYSWVTSLIYYVEKYNLRLLPEFEQKVLNNA